MIKPYFALSLLTALTLTACGGGSSSESSPAPSKLAAYVGTWTGPCEYQSMTTVTISNTVGVKDTATHNFKVSYFAQPHCSGPVVATETYSTDLTETYTGTATVGVVFREGAAAVMTKIDTVSRQGPAYTRSVTGPNVTHTIDNGKPMICINTGEGSQTCSDDMGLVPALAPTAGGIFRDGNEMFHLRLRAGVYTASSAMTKH